MGLLKKINADNLVTGHSTEVDLLDEKEQKIVCYRCGFVNSSNSTVCKECNALLKGDVVVPKEKEHHYYQYWLFVQKDILSMWSSWFEDAKKKAEEALKATSQVVSEVRVFFL